MHPVRIVIGAWALALAGLALCGCQAPESSDAALAAVLDAKGQVVLVDLDRGRIIGRVRLRSRAGDIEADQETGCFLTAQCGGVGTDADDAVGVISPRGRVSVRYIELPRANPLGVAALRDGRVLVDHGWQEVDGMFACIIDTRTGHVERSGHLPDNDGPVTVAAGVGWSPGVDVATGRPSLRRVELSTLESTEVPAVGGPAFVECETLSGVAGWLRPGPADVLLARFDARTGSVLATQAMSFVDGPGRLILCARSLVAVDFSAEDLERPGSRLLVLEAESLRPIRTIDVPGGPSDVAEWRGLLVVVNYRDQTLQVIDPATARVQRTVQLPPLAPLPLHVAVLDECR